jgi:uncharacterized membrane protein
VQALTLPRNNQTYVRLILLFFGLLYATISLLNHYMFRTTAWDMAIFNNALYDYAHGRMNYAMVRIPMSPTAKNLLGDHLELYPILVAPLYYVFGSYTLLLVQIASILWGGYGTYRFILHKTGNLFLSRLALFHFFSIWGIYTALAFDYHNNVVAAMGVPWFLYYFDKKKFGWATLLFVFVVIGKENMPLWMGFIGLALGAWHFRDRASAIAGFAYAVAGFVFFILAIKVIIPAFAPPDAGYSYNTYTALGNDFGEVLKTVLTRPWYTFKLLFINQTGSPGADDAKLMTHIAVILSGGWALFYRPKYLFMLLPIYGQKLFYDGTAEGTSRWGVYCHYSIEFVPIITIALFLTLFSLYKDREKWLQRTAAISIVVTATLTIYILKQRRDTHHKATHQFYLFVHFKREFNVREAHHTLNTLIPDNASVSAQSCLAPHLSFRDTIYQYPAGLNSDYIVLSAAQGPYQFSLEEYDNMRKAYAADPNREIIYDKNSMIIIRKKEFRSAPE